MAFYDFFAKSKKTTRVGRIINNYQNAHFLELIRAFVPSPQISLLEIGPGKGSFAKLCNDDQHISYTGIEANSAMFEALREGGFKVYKDFVPPINIEDRFDVILMNQVVEHMKGRDQVVELISSCRDRLLDNGIIIISSPEILFARDDFFADYTHDYPTSLPRLCQLLLDDGFKILHTDFYIFFARGYATTRILSALNRVAGLARLFFAKRKYMVKVTLPSCLVIGQKV